MTDTITAADLTVIDDENERRAAYKRRMVARLESERAQALMAYEDETDPLARENYMDIACDAAIAIDCILNR